MITVLYPETLFPDDIVERDVFGPDVQILVRSVGTLAELDAADCEPVTGLIVMRHHVTADDFARFPRLAERQGQKASTFSGGQVLG